MPKNETVQQAMPIDPEIVNIRRYPERIVSNPNYTITIGDMHGNTMKLMWSLIRYGIINMSEEDFNEMWKIYDGQMEPKKGLDAFERILGKIKVDAGYSIRLLGDVFSDRGNNDWYTLKVLEKLDESGVKKEIILSNHDIQLFLDYENSAAEDKSHYTGGGLSQNKSWDGLLDFVEKKGVVKRVQLQNMVELHIMPCVKLISYVLSEDGEKIQLFMHAPNNGEIIKNVAQELGVVYRDGSAIELALTIDRINVKFQELNSTEHDLFRAKLIAAITINSERKIVIWDGENSSGFLVAAGEILLAKVGNGYAAGWQVEGEEFSKKLDSGLVHLVEEYKKSTTLQEREKYRSEFLVQLGIGSYIGDLAWNRLKKNCKYRLVYVEYGDGSTEEDKKAKLDEEKRKAVEIQKEDPSVITLICDGDKKLHVQSLVASKRFGELGEVSDVKSWFPVGYKDGSTVDDDEARFKIFGKLVTSCSVESLFSSGCIDFQTYPEYVSGVSHGHVGQDGVVGAADPRQINLDADIGKGDEFLGKPFYVASLAAEEDIGKYLESLNAINFPILVKQGEKLFLYNKLKDKTILPFEIKFTIINPPESQKEGVIKLQAKTDDERVIGEYVFTFTDKVKDIKKISSTQENYPRSLLTWMETQSLGSFPVLVTNEEGSKKLLLSHCKNAIQSWLKSSDQGWFSRRPKVFRDATGLDAKVDALAKALAGESQQPERVQQALREALNSIEDISKNHSGELGNYTASFGILKQQAEVLAEAYEAHKVLISAPVAQAPSQGVDEKKFQRWESFVRAQTATDAVAPKEDTLARVDTGSGGIPDLAKRGKPKKFPASLKELVGDPIERLKATAGISVTEAHMIGEQPGAKRAKFGGDARSIVSTLDDSLASYGITYEQMESARQKTCVFFDKSVLNLREAQEHLYFEDHMEQGSSVLSTPEKVKESKDALHMDKAMFCVVATPTKIVFDASAGDYDSSDPDRHVGEFLREPIDINFVNGTGPCLKDPADYYSDKARYVDAKGALKPEYQKDYVKMLKLHINALRAMGSKNLVLMLPGSGAFASNIPKLKKEAFEAMALAVAEVCKGEAVAGLESITFCVPDFGSPTPFEAIEQKLKENRGSFKCDVNLTGQTSVATAIALYDAGYRDLGINNAGDHAKTPGCYGVVGKDASAESAILGAVAGYVSCQTPSLNPALKDEKHYIALNVDNPATTLLEIYGVNGPEKGAERSVAPVAADVEPLAPVVESTTQLDSLAVVAAQDTTTDIIDDIPRQPMLTQILSKISEIEKFYSEIVEKLASGGTVSGSDVDKMKEHIEYLQDFIDIKVIGIEAATNAKVEELLTSMNGLLPQMSQHISQPQPIAASASAVPVTTISAANPPAAVVSAPDLPPILSVESKGPRETLEKLLSDLGLQKKNLQENPYKLYELLIAVLGSSDKKDQEFIISNKEAFEKLFRQATVQIAQALKQHLIQLINVVPLDEWKKPKSTNEAKLAIDAWNMAIQNYVLGKLNIDVYQRSANVEALIWLAEACRAENDYNTFNIIKFAIGSSSKAKEIEGSLSAAAGQWLREWSSLGKADDEKQHKETSGYIVVPNLSKWIKGQVEQTVENLRSIRLQQDGSVAVYVDDDRIIRPRDEHLHSIVQPLADLESFRVVKVKIDSDLVTDIEHPSPSVQQTNPEGVRKERSEKSVITKLDLGQQEKQFSYGDILLLIKDKKLRTFMHDFLDKKCFINKSLLIKLVDSYSNFSQENIKIVSDVLLGIGIASVEVNEFCKAICCNAIKNPILAMIVEQKISATTTPDYAKIAEVVSMINKILEKEISQEEANAVFFVLESMGIHICDQSSFLPLLSSAKFLSDHKEISTYADSEGNALDPDLASNMQLLQNPETSFVKKLEVYEGFVAQKKQFEKGSEEKKNELTGYLVIARKNLESLQDVEATKEVRDKLQKFITWAEEAIGGIDTLRVELLKIDGSAKKSLSDDFVAQVDEFKQIDLAIDKGGEQLLLGANKLQRGNYELVPSFFTRLSALNISTGEFNEQDYVGKYKKAIDVLVALPANADNVLLKKDLSTKKDLLDLSQKIEGIQKYAKEASAKILAIAKEDRDIEPSEIEDIKKKYNELASLQKQVRDFRDRYSREKEAAGGEVEPINRIQSLLKAIEMLERKNREAEVFFVRTIPWCAVFTNAKKSDFNEILLKAKRKFEQGDGEYFAELDKLFDSQSGLQILSKELSIMDEESFQAYCWLYLGNDISKEKPNAFLRALRIDGLSVATMESASRPTLTSKQEAATYFKWLSLIEDPNIRKLILDRKLRFKPDINEEEIRKFNSMTFDRDTGVSKLPSLKSVRIGEQLDKILNIVQFSEEEKTDLGHTAKQAALHAMLPPVFQMLLEKNTLHAEVTLLAGRTLLIGKTLGIVKHIARDFDELLAASGESVISGLWEDILAKFEQVGVKIDFNGLSSKDSVVASYLAKCGYEVKIAEGENVLHAAARMLADAVNSNDEIKERNATLIIHLLLKDPTIAAKLNVGNKAGETPWKVLSTSIVFSKPLKQSQLYMVDVLGKGIEEKQYWDLVFNNIASQKLKSLVSNLLVSDPKYPGVFELSSNPSVRALYLLAQSKSYDLVAQVKKCWKPERLRDSMEGRSNVVLVNLAFEGGGKVLKDDQEKIKTSLLNKWMELQQIESLEEREAKIDIFLNSDELPKGLNTESKVSIRGMLSVRAENLLAESLKAVSGNVLAVLLAPINAHFINDGKGNFKFEDSHYEQCRQEILDKLAAFKKIFFSDISRTVTDRKLAEIHKNLITVFTNFLTQKIDAETQFPGDLEARKAALFQNWLGTMKNAIEAFSNCYAGRDFLDNLDLVTTDYFSEITNLFGINESNIPQIVQTILGIQQRVKAGGADAADASKALLPSKVVLEALIIERADDINKVVQNLDADLKARLEKYVIPQDESQDLEVLLKSFTETQETLVELEAFIKQHFSIFAAIDELKSAGIEIDTSLIEASLGEYKAFKGKLEELKKGREEFKQKIKVYFQETQVQKFCDLLKLMETKISLLENADAEDLKEQYAQSVSLEPDFLGILDEKQNLKVLQEIAKTDTDFANELDLLQRYEKISSEFEILPEIIEAKQLDEALGKLDDDLEQLLLEALGKNPEDSEPSDQLRELNRLIELQESRVVHSEKFDSILFDLKPKRKWLILMARFEVTEIASTLTEGIGAKELAKLLNKKLRALPGKKIEGVEFNEADAKKLKQLFFHAYLGKSHVDSLLQSLLSGSEQLKTQNRSRYGSTLGVVAKINAAWGAKDFAKVIRIAGEQLGVKIDLSVESLTTLDTSFPDAFSLLSKIKQIFRERNFDTTVANYVSGESDRRSPKIIDGGYGNFLSDVENKIKGLEKFISIKAVGDLLSDSNKVKTILNVRIKVNSLRALLSSKEPSTISSKELLRHIAGLKENVKTLSASEYTESSDFCHYAEKLIEDIKGLQEILLSKLLDNYLDISMPQEGSSVYDAIEILYFIEDKIKEGHEYHSGEMLEKLQAAKGKCESFVNPRLQSYIAKISELIKQESHLEAAKFIVDLINSSELSSGKKVGADELLPLAVYILRTINPQDFLAFKAALSQYAAVLGSNPGEIGNVTASIISAIEHLRQQATETQQILEEPVIPKFSDKDLYLLLSSSGIKSPNPEELKNELGKMVESLRTSGNRELCDALDSMIKNPEESFAAYSKFLEQKAQEELEKFKIKVDTIFSREFFKILHDSELIQKAVLGRETIGMTGGFIAFDIFGVVIDLLGRNRGRIAIEALQYIPTDLLGGDDIRRRIILDSMVFEAGRAAYGEIQETLLNAYVNSGTDAGESTVQIYKVAIDDAKKRFFDSLSDVQREDISKTLSEAKPYQVPGEFKEQFDAVKKTISNIKSTVEEFKQWLLDIEAVPPTSDLSKGYDIYVKFKQNLAAFTEQQEQLKTDLTNMEGCETLFRIVHALSDVIKQMSMVHVTGYGSLRSIEEAYCIKAQAVEADKLDEIRRLLEVKEDDSVFTTSNKRNIKHGIPLLVAEDLIKRQEVLLKELDVTSFVSKRLASKTKGDVDEAYRELLKSKLWVIESCAKELKSLQQQVAELKLPADSGYTKNLSQLISRVCEQQGALSALQGIRIRDVKDASGVVSETKDEHIVNGLRERFKSYANAVQIVLLSNLDPQPLEALEEVQQMIGQLEKNPELISNEKDFESYLYKLVEVTSKYTHQKPARALADLNIAEGLYSAMKLGAQALCTVTAVTGGGAIIQRDTPLSYRYTEAQVMEYLSVLKPQGQPKWFRDLPTFAQKYLQEKLGPVKEAFDSGVIESAQYELGRVIGVLPTTLRKLPGMANYMLHTATILAVDGNVMSVVAETQNVRASTLSPIGMKDKTEQLKVATDNLEQVVRTHYDMLVARLKAKGLSDTQIEKKLSEEIPILVQSLVTPLRPDFTHESEMVEVKEAAIAVLREKIGRGEITIKVGSKDIPIKPTFISTNHPINKYRKGLLSILVKSRDKENLEAAKKLISLAENYLSSHPDDKILLEALKVYQSLMRDGKHKEMKRDENLFRGALELIIVDRMDGLGVSGCKSGKDRRGMEGIYADAMIEYFAKKDKFPSPKDSDKERQEFVAIVVKLFKAGHAQELAALNAAGVRGLKSLKGGLPDDVLKALGRDFLEENKVLAAQNKPKIPGLIIRLVARFRELLGLSKAAKMPQAEVASTDERERKPAVGGKQPMGLVAEPKVNEAKTADAAETKAVAAPDKPANSSLEPQSWRRSEQPTLRNSVGKILGVIGAAVVCTISGVAVPIAVGALAAITIVACRGGDGVKKEVKPEELKLALNKANDNELRQFIKANQKVIIEARGPINFLKQIGFSDEELKNEPRSFAKTFSSIYVSIELSSKRLKQIPLNPSQQKMHDELTELFSKKVEGKDGLKAFIKTYEAEIDRSGNINEFLKNIGFDPTSTQGIVNGFTAAYRVYQHEAREISAEDVKRLQEEIAEAEVSKPSPPASAA